MMETFNYILAQNPLRTRQDTVLLLLDLIRPLRSHYSPDGTTLHIGSTSAHYGERGARVEGWARVLWGLGPLFSGDNSSLPAAVQIEIKDWASLYRTGLIHGTDPKSPGYWGDIYDFDQKMVETAALDVALALSPATLWEPLTDCQRENVFHWLNQMNEHKIHPNNWRFFRILTNMVFARLGLPVNHKRLKEDFDVIERCYIGDGWYFDGHNGQIDYYIPFAMHFYSLIWAALSPLDGNNYRETLKSRSIRFAEDFVHWFASDGAEIPFGRSLTYRFAHSAFFPAMALAGVKPDSMSWGAVRHITLQNLRHWMQYPVTAPDGILTIGYQYPNLLMSEKYNAPGSPYWAFKAFLFLALPEDHTFWQGEESTVPHPAQMVQEKPRMIICHENQGGKDHVTAYPAGQHAMEHGNCAAKYEKFVYSNYFGFSISRGDSLDAGAFDNTLAASPAGWNCYRMRYGVEEYAVTSDYTYTHYALLPGVTAKSWVIPCGGGWHVRVHRIVTDRAIDTADGGFALPVEQPFTLLPNGKDGKLLPGKEEAVSGGIGAFLSWGASAACALDGGEPCRCEMVRTFPNTNLMAPLCAVPTVITSLRPGNYLLIHAFFGDAGGKAEAALAIPPKASLEPVIAIHKMDGTLVNIDTAD